MKLAHVSLVALSLSLAVGSTALAAGTNEPIQGELRNVELTKPEPAGDKAARKDAQKKKKTEKTTKGEKTKKTKKVTKKKKATKKAKGTPASKPGTAKNLG